LKEHAQNLNLAAVQPAARRSKRSRQARQQRRTAPSGNDGDDDGAPPGEPPVFLRINDLRRRYGNVSNMWIERRLRNDASFPRPFVSLNHRLWKRVELEIWESRLAREGVGPTRPQHDPKRKSSEHPEHPETTARPREVTATEA